MYHRICIIAPQSIIHTIAHSPSDSLGTSVMQRLRVSAGFTQENTKGLKRYRANPHNINRTLASFCISRTTTDVSLRYVYMHFGNILCHNCYRTGISPSVLSHRRRKCFAYMHSLLTCTDDDAMPLLSYLHSIKEHCIIQSHSACI